ncbi:MAG: nucleoside triphosphate pyrophosphohydrolase [Gammaproteobacteria bacterium]
MTDKPPIERLLGVMAKLRDPDSGCPWDREQTWKSLLEHTLEEAYEVAAAIETDQPASEVANELGDLLFQVVFYSQIATEEDKFTFNDVVTRLSDKLERRHPHVFGDRNLKRHELDKVWHETKAREREAKAMTSVLDDIPNNLPAMTRAQKIQRRAANEGFDWSDHQGVFDKLDEETVELKQAIESNQAAEIEEELGDMFFTLVNLSRHFSVDAETSLRRSANKFEQRYRQMETLIQQDGLKVSELDQDVLERYWQQVKQS